MNKAPRVFVVNEPLRINRETGEAGRFFDLTPAIEFGSLVHLLPAGQLPSDPDWVFDRVIAKMTQHDFRSTDYLLPVGDQTAIIMAGIVAARKTNKSFKLLRWNSRLGKYSAVHIVG